MCRGEVVPPCPAGHLRVAISAPATPAGVVVPPPTRGASKAEAGLEFPGSGLITQDRSSSSVPRTKTCATYSNYKEATGRHGRYAHTRETHPSPPHDGRGS